MLYCLNNSNYFAMLGLGKSIQVLSSHQILHVLLLLFIVFRWKHAGVVVRSREEFNAFVEAVQFLVHSSVAYADAGPGIICILFSL